VDTIPVFSRTVDYRPAANRLKRFPSLRRGRHLAIIGGDNASPGCRKAAETLSWRANQNVRGRDKPGPSSGILYDPVDRRAARPYGGCPAINRPSL